MAASKQRSTLPVPTVENLHTLLTSYLSDPDPSVCVVFGKKETFKGAKGNKVDLPYHFIDKAGKEWASSVSGDTVIIRGLPEAKDNAKPPKDLSIKISKVTAADIAVGDYKKKDTSTMAPEVAAKYEADYNKTIETYVRKTNMLAELGLLLDRILPAAFRRWYATVGKDDPDVMNQMVWPIWTTRVKVVVDGATTWKEVTPYFGIKAPIFKYDIANAKHLGAEQYDKMIGFYWAASKKFVHTFKRVDPNTGDKVDAYVEFKDGRRPITAENAHLFITKNSALKIFTIEFAPMSISSFGIAFPRKFAGFKPNVIKTHVTKLMGEQLTPEQQAAEQAQEEEEGLFDAPEPQILDETKVAIQAQPGTTGKATDLSAVKELEAQFQAQSLVQIPPVTQMAPAPAPITIPPPVTQMAPAPAAAPQYAQPMQQYPAVPQYVQQPAPAALPAVPQYVQQPAPAALPAIPLSLPPQFAGPTIPSISNILPSN